MTLFLFGAVVDGDDARTDSAIAGRRAELRLSLRQIARGLELDDMAARLLGHRKLWVFRELAVLPRELGEREEVRDLAYAHLFFAGGALGPDQ